MKTTAFLLLAISLLLEISVSTIPFILIVLLCLMVLVKEKWIFVYAFIFGAILDALTFKFLGVSSLFYIVFLFLVLLYRRRFEIATNYFISAASFFGSFAYLFLFTSRDSIIFESILSAIIGLILFRMLQRAIKIK